MERRERPVCGLFDRRAESGAFVPRDCDVQYEGVADFGIYRSLSRVGAGLPCPRKPSTVGTCITTHRRDTARFRLS